MRRFGEIAKRHRSRLPVVARGAGIVLATAGIAAALAACGDSSYVKVTEYDVGAQVVDNSGDPVPGVQVQVWIVDVDQSVSNRQPLPMNPRVTTGTNGFALWKYQAVSEPVVCGYQVLDQAGTVLVDEQPETSKDFGAASPSFVQVTLDR
jgi:hypothetical protein